MMMPTSGCTAIPPESRRSRADRRQSGFDIPAAGNQSHPLPLPATMSTVDPDNRRKDADMMERKIGRRRLCAGLVAGTMLGGKLLARDNPLAPTLFDGKTLDGWEGNKEVWSVADGVIVGQHQGRGNNEFLSAKANFDDFVLAVRFRLADGFGNSGVQFRSERIPNHHEMIGYQADVGEQYWGCLYDESRRRKVLAGPDEATRRQAVREKDWNTYVIQCQGPRIVLSLNGVTTVDYTEPDAAIPQKGKIALQVHSNAKPVKVEFSDIRLTKMTAPR